jgi:hypothetical protein
MTKTTYTQNQDELLDRVHCHSLHEKSMLYVQGAERLY